jgi:hypothetical protein
LAFLFFSFFLAGGQGEAVELVPLAGEVLPASQDLLDLPANASELPRQSISARAECLLLIHLTPSFLLLTVKMSVTGWNWKMVDLFPDYDATRRFLLEGAVRVGQGAAQPISSKYNLLKQFTFD